MNFFSEFFLSPRITFLCLFETIYEKEMEWDEKIFREKKKK